MGSRHSVPGLDDDGRAVANTCRGVLSFYRRWIFANGWAEAAGLGTTFLVGGYLAPLLEGRRGLVIVLSGSLAAVLLGTLLEGVVIGAAQAGVVRTRLVALRRRDWVLATAAGAGLAWALGMVPSTILALSPSESGGAPPPEPGAMVQYMLASVLGVVAGPILGLAQWTVLRRHVSHASRWLWANALAWAIGMPLIFFGMDHVPWTGHPAARFASIYAVCGATGLVVGAVHGRVIDRLTRSQVDSRLS